MLLSACVSAAEWLLQPCLNCANNFFYEKIKINLKRPFIRAAFFIEKLEFFLGSKTQSRFHGLECGYNGRISEDCEPSKSINPKTNEMAHKTKTMRAIVPNLSERR